MDAYGKPLGFIESRLLDHSCICQWGDFYLIWARHWNELHLHPPAGVRNTGTSLFLAGSPNIYGKWTHYHRPFWFQQGFESHFLLGPLVRQFWSPNHWSNFHPVARRSQFGGLPGPLVRKSTATGALRGWRQCLTLGMRHSKSTKTYDSIMYHFLDSQGCLGTSLKSNVLEGI